MILLLSCLDTSGFQPLTLKLEIVLSTFSLTGKYSSEALKEISTECTDKAVSLILLDSFLMEYIP
ncbi:hypothetical protein AMJ80_03915 [bacterium SM23_31]|nr:MAG: hypothetical protein AMJ80_03915 [bacterium SM23_31]